MPSAGAQCLTVKMAIPTGGLASVKQKRHGAVSTMAWPARDPAHPAPVRQVIIMNLSVKKDPFPKAMTVTGILRSGPAASCSGVAWWNIVAASATCRRNWRKPMTAAM